MLTTIDRLGQMKDFIYFDFIMLMSSCLRQAVKKSMTVLMMLQVREGFKKKKKKISGLFH